jgi:hypothetical protein
MGDIIMMVRLLVHSARKWKRQSICRTREPSRLMPTVVSTSTLHATSGRTSRSPSQNRNGTNRNHDR